MTDLRIVFQNEFFIAVEKPAGILSVPGRMGTAGRGPDILRLLAEKAHGRVLPVHRLDQAVSGVLLFALDSKGHRAANGWFEKRQIGKRYEALTEGSPPSLARTDTVHWEVRMLRGKKRAYESPAGKMAITEAAWLGTVVVREQQLQLWSLRPLTGRPHQIRFELARRGNPVWGDALYGAVHPFPLPEGIGLRAVSLDFRSCPGAPAFGLPPNLEVPPLVTWFENV